MGWLFVAEVYAAVSLFPERDEWSFFVLPGCHYRAWIEQMERPLITIVKLKKPVIAKVQGVAAVNGMGLVASVDLSIAAEQYQDWIDGYQRRAFV